MAHMIKLECVAVRKGKHFDGISPVWDYEFQAVNPTGDPQHEHDIQFASYPTAGYKLSSLTELEYDVYDQVYLEFVTPTP